MDEITDKEAHEGLRLTLNEHKYMCYNRNVYGVPIHKSYLSYLFILCNYKRALAEFLAYVQHRNNYPSKLPYCCEMCLEHLTVDNGYHSSDAAVVVCECSRRSRWFHIGCWHKKIQAKRKPLTCDCCKCPYFYLSIPSSYYLFPELFNKPIITI
jgi:hypothetical protein